MTRTELIVGVQLLDSLVSSSAQSCVALLMVTGLCSLVSQAGRAKDEIRLIQLSPYRFNQLHMQNYGQDDQQQASMVFGMK